MPTKNSALSAKDRKSRIDNLIASLGLREQSHTLIGTPLRRGLSGGQKRRVGVAGQLLAAPRVLFLDEPTSGLDARAAWEVMRHLRDVVARRHRLIVIASIHQPSAATFQLFDKLLLLSGGRPYYFGPVADVAGFCETPREEGGWGLTLPAHTNTAEFLLELVNTDFAADRNAAQAKLEDLQRGWEASSRCHETRAAIYRIEESGVDSRKPEKQMHDVVDSPRLNTNKPGFASVVLTLLHRSFIKSYRDVVAYGIRVAMYLGLAVMMGTVWLRLSTEQSSIIPITNGLVS